MKTRNQLDKNAAREKGLVTARARQTIWYSSSDYFPPRKGCLVNFCPAVCIYMIRSAPVGHDSSVANFAQGAMKGQWPLSVWGLRSEGVEQFGRSEVLFSDLHDHLSFLEHVHEFDPDQSILGCLERFEP